MGEVPEHVGMVMAESKEAEINTRKNEQVTRAESLSGREDMISERQVDSPYLLSL